MVELMALVAAEPRGLDPDIVKPGWLGLIVVVLLCLGIVVLARSLSKHTRRAKQPWEGETPDDAGSGDDTRRP